jgi:hypothetical protein
MLQAVESAIHMSSRLSDIDHYFPDYGLKYESREKDCCLVILKLDSSKNGLQILIKFLNSMSM